MILCSACETKLLPSRIGVLVVQHADFGPQTIWKADEYYCPKCHGKVVCNFATKPLAEYWQTMVFEQVMQTTKKNPGNVVHCREFTVPVAEAWKESTHD